MSKRTGCISGKSEQAGAESFIAAKAANNLVMTAVAVRNPECPICEETFKDGRGLSGHLQFKHGLSDEEHREMLDEGMDRGEKSEQPAPDGAAGWSGRSVRDRELELKGRLQEIKEKRERIQENDRSWGILGVRIQTDVKAKEALEELEEREQEVREELRKLQN